jgi:hypothetical protein
MLRADNSKDNTQIPLGHHDYRLVCESISRRISPASQIFYPGAVFAFLFFQNHFSALMLTLRCSPIRGRYGSLDELELTDIRVLCAARHSRGPQRDRS